VFPTHTQVLIVANGAESAQDKRLSLQGAGLCVWLMHGCGLRIEEALEVEKKDFIEDGTVLRVSGQASRDGRTKEPLKHRNPGEYRDVPVPSWLWDMVKDTREGPLMPGNDGKPYAVYQTILRRFTRAAEAASIAGDFTPHSLRPAYASAMLRNSVPLRELAHYLGHRSIEVTHKIYGHLLPSAVTVARAALDSEYEQWSKT
jgi:integrase